MWWMLCKVQGIIQHYYVAVARHAAVLDTYVLSLYDEYLGLDEDEFDEYRALEIAHVADLQRLYREYRQVVGWIPSRAAENMRDVHDCGMVFQVLLDFQEEDVVRDWCPVQGAHLKSASAPFIKAQDARKDAAS